AGGQRRMRRGFQEMSGGCWAWVGGIIQEGGNQGAETKIHDRGGQERSGRDVSFPQCRDKGETSCGLQNLFQLRIFTQEGGSFHPGSKGRRYGRNASLLAGSGTFDICDDPGHFGTLLAVPRQTGPCEESQR